MIIPGIIVVIQMRIMMESAITVEPSVPADIMEAVRMTMEIQDMVITAAMGPDMDPAIMADAADNSNGWH